MRTLNVALLTLLLLVTNAFAQKTTPPAAAQKTTSPVVVETLDGIGIGSSIDDVRSRLAQIGTGGGRDTRDGGRKEAWTLKETDYASLAFKTNKAGKVVWVSAFVRPGREILFTKLGDPAKATTLTQAQAIWNVNSSGSGYRLVAKGAEGKASVVYLLSLDFPEIE
jgi:hypothetical protein